MMNIQVVAKREQARVTAVRAQKGVQRRSAPTWQGRLLHCVAVAAVGMAAAAAQAGDHFPCAENNDCNARTVALCAGGSNSGKVCTSDADCGGGACRTAWEEYFIDAGSEFTCIPNAAANGGSGADGVDLADFDGDGDIDVVTGWEESGVTYVYFNPCNPINSFNPTGCYYAAQVQDPWPAADARGGAGTGSIEDAVFADFDLDGRPDGVATATEGTNKHVKIHGWTPPNTWVGESLPGTKHLYMQVRVGDINGDGCADVLSGNKIAHPPDCYNWSAPAGVRCHNCDLFNVTCDEVGGIWWWESPVDSIGACEPFGPGWSYVPPEIDTSDWNKRRIDSGFYWIMGLDLVDMDGDGDNDVLYSDRFEVGWFRNRTDEGNLAGWNAPIRIDTEQAIHDRRDGGGYSSGEPFRFHAYGDVDGDGLKDVVVTASFSKGFCAINRDRDCKTNADCAAGDTCVNDGDRFAGYFYRRLNVEGTLWDINPIFVKGGLPYGLDYKNDKVSKGVAIGDVTGNGRMDLVFSVRGKGHSLYMLTYDPVPGQCGPCLNHEWNAYPIAPCRKLSKYDNVQLADIDRDGRLDVVSSEENYSPGNLEQESKGLGVVWYRNFGFCGNGRLDDGEQCDNGDANGTFGQCCDTSCRFTQGNVCRESSGAVCDAAEVCSGTRATCTPDTVPVGMPCGGSEVPCSDRACDENGFCVPATEGQTCPDDGNQCTRDVCSGTACVHPFRNNEPCELSVGDPECSIGVCRASDGNIRCTWTPINQGGPCGDSEAQGPCDAPDTCDFGACDPNFLAPQLCRAATNECENDAYCTGSTPECPPNPVRTGYSCSGDANPCTADICNDDAVCTHPLRPPTWFCGAGGECTIQYCDGAGNCETQPESGPCGEDDGNPCTYSNCVEGVCTLLLRTDGSPCPDDGSACTVDQCMSGVCEHLPAVGQSCDFDDGNPCTRSVCGEDGTCSDVVGLEGLICGSQNNDACDAPDRCNAAGECVDLLKPQGFTCASAGQCLQRVCDGVSTECPAGEPAPKGTLCFYDGNSCTTHTCDGGGECVMGFAPAGQPCPDDDNRCTHDACDGAGTCAHVAFEDESPCGGSNGCEVCQGGECLTLPAGSLCGLDVIGREDTDCTDPDTCDEFGACLPNHAPDGTVCEDDGLSCTAEVCEQGQCTHPPLGQPSVPAGLCSMQLSAAGSGFQRSIGAGTYPGVNSFLRFDDGGGEDLYAGGGIANVVPNPVQGVARWNGSDWEMVGDSLGPLVFVLALARHDDGNGAKLYAAGIGSDNFIVRLEGSAWSASLGAPDHYVHAMVSYDDGNGAALYVGGRFTHIDGVAFNGIAKWNGSSWSALGSGVEEGPFGDPPAVLALTVYDFGDGPVLVAGGDFAMAGGVPAQGIAQWNGTAWAPVAPATPLEYGSVQAFAVHDDGSGPTLFIGGDFSRGNDANNFIFNVARLGPGGWERINGLIFGPVKALEVFDDGLGPKLYAAGYFTIQGPSAPCCFAKWDGVSWTAPGPCLNNGLNALAPFDDGSINGLFLGGKFTGIEGTDYVARWACTADNDCNDNLTPDNEEPDCDGNGTPDDCDLAAGGTDCQPDGILDACELDWLDDNHNGVPDDCDLFQKYDWSADCSIDAGDMPGFAECMRGPGVGAQAICRFVFDDDQDDDVDLKDAAVFMNQIGTVPPLPCE